MSKIDTRDIARRAITAKKLHGKAVKTAKLSGGAVTTDKLADAAVTSRELADGVVQTRHFSQSAPVPLAGVVVYQSVGGAQIFSWFNRLTDEQPTLERVQTGVYDLQIPGLESPAPFAYSELLIPSI